MKFIIFLITINNGVVMASDRSLTIREIQNPRVEGKQFHPKEARFYFVTDGVKNTQIMKYRGAYFNQDIPDAHTSIDEAWNLTTSYNPMR